MVFLWPLHAFLILFARFHGPLHVFGAFDLPHTISHLSAAAHQLALRQRRPPHHGGLGDEVLRPRVAVQVEHRGGLLAHEVGGQHGLGGAYWATQEDVLSGQVGQQ